MDRVNKCVRFQSKRISRFVVIYLLIYVLSYGLAAAVMAIESVRGQSHGTVNANFSYFAVILAFIGISSAYKGLFNNLLIFGNTRSTIQCSFFTFAVLFSAELAALSEISELLNVCLGHFFPMIKSTGLSKVYTGLNPLQELLWFFTLILIFVMLGYLYGAFTYKFGKIFVVGFWCGIGLLLTCSSLLSDADLLSALYKAAVGFFGYGVPGGVYLCSLHFLITSIVLGIILWVITIRQPQNA